MRTHRKAKSMALRADHGPTYRPTISAVLLALALAFFLAWHGMARAEGFDPPAQDRVQLPDSPHGQPGADRIPPGLACTDDMDLTPEDRRPSPFDANTVAFRTGRGIRALPVESDDGCPARRPARTVEV